MLGADEVEVVPSPKFHFHATIVPSASDDPSLENAIVTGAVAAVALALATAVGGRLAGADTDIVVASAKAYIDALNKLQSKLERLNPQV